MAIESMMELARRWGLDTVTLTQADGGWRRFPAKHGRQESGLKMYVSSADPMHMVEYMRSKLHSLAVYWDIVVLKCVDIGSASVRRKFSVAEGARVNIDVPFELVAIDVPRTIRPHVCA